MYFSQTVLLTREDCASIRNGIGRPTEEALNSHADGGTHKLRVSE